MKVSYQICTSLLCLQAAEAKPRARRVTYRCNECSHCRNPRLRRPCKARAIMEEQGHRERVSPGTASAWPSLNTQRAAHADSPGPSDPTHGALLHSSSAEASTSHVSSEALNPSCAAEPEDGAEKLKGSAEAILEDGQGTVSGTVSSPVDEHAVHEDVEPEGGVLGSCRARRPSSPDVPTSFTPSAESPQFLRRVRTSVHSDKLAPTSTSAGATFRPMVSLTTEFIEWVYASASPATRS